MYRAYASYVNPGRAYDRRSVCELTSCCCLFVPVAFTPQESNPVKTKISPDESLVINTLLLQSSTASPTGRKHCFGHFELSPFHRRSSSASDASWDDMGIPPSKDTLLKRYPVAGLRFLFSDTLVTPPQHGFSATFGWLHISDLLTSFHGKIPKRQIHLQGT